MESSHFDTPYSEKDEDEEVEGTTPNHDRVSEPADSERYGASLFRQNQSPARQYHTRVPGVLSVLEAPPPERSRPQWETLASEPHLPETAAVSSSLPVEARADGEDDEEDEDESEEQTVAEHTTAPSEEQPGPVYYANEAALPAVDANHQPPAAHEVPQVQQSVAAEAAPASSIDDRLANLIRQAGVDPNELIPSPSNESSAPPPSAAPEGGHPQEMARATPEPTSEATHHQPPPPPGELLAGLPAFEEPQPHNAATIPAPSFEQPAINSAEYVSAYEAKKKTLFAFAAGVILGDMIGRLGKKKMKKELKLVNDKIEQLKRTDKEQAIRDQHDQAAADNKQYWDRRVGSEQTPAQIYRPTAEQRPFEAALPVQANQPPSIENAPEAAEAVDPFHPKTEQHIEQDAWHSIVVDKHNHEDLSARSLYGKEFLQEQREVHRQQPAAQPYVGASLTNAGAPAHPQQAAVPNGVVSYTGLPDGVTNPELPSGTPTHADPQHLLAAAGKHSTAVLFSPWAWLLIGLLLLIFFGASFIG
jgi:hypothetical protein